MKHLLNLLCALSHLRLWNLETLLLALSLCSLPFSAAYQISNNRPSSNMDHFHERVQLSFLRYAPLGFVTNVDNQGKSENCWAFSTVGAINGNLATRGYGQCLGSVQELIDLVPLIYPQDHNLHIPMQGRRSHPLSALRYVRNRGLYLNHSYPFVGYCQTATGLTRPRPLYMADSKIIMHDFGWLPGNQFHNILDAFLGDGHGAPYRPLIGGLVPTDTFMGLGPADVVYRLPLDSVELREGDGLHAVMIIGVGWDYDHRPYYLIKNSWGPAWGHGGYAKVAVEMMRDVFFPTNCDVVPVIPHYPPPRPSPRR